MLTKMFDELFEIFLLIKQALLIYIHRNRAKKILLTRAVVDGREIITNAEEKMQITDVQKAVFDIADGDIVDVKGNPAPVDETSWVWSSSDPAILAVTGTGRHVEAAAVGPLGHAQLLGSVDADLGAGVTTIQGIKEFDVVASQAVAINIPDVAPVDQ